MTRNKINNTSSDLQVSNIDITNSTISTISTNSDLILSANTGNNIFIENGALSPTTNNTQDLGSVANSWNNVYANGLSFDNGANIMGAYEGTQSYTPSLTFGGGSTGMTYLSQTGNYNRIGSLYFYFFRIFLSAKGTSTGVARISLPTSFGVNLSRPGGFIARVSHFNMGSYKYIAQNLRQMDSNGFILIGILNNAATVQISDVDMTDDTLILGTGFYWE